MKPVHFEGTAYEQFVEWALEDFTVFEKIVQLIKDISRDPFKGLGKPEPLRHKYKGYWSRRITQEHRLIYKMSDGVIVIASLRGHYE
ncbi:MAG: Txe/YoeB family addiction module toxin [Haliscomenobacteraceae bacterium CHB4]|nr:Txe/YoeB family addiction module toxin [Haliscomenobacteraceae bacterium CHB4]